MQELSMRLNHQRRKLYTDHQKILMTKDFWNGDKLISHGLENYGEGKIEVKSRRVSGSVIKM